MPILNKNMPPPPAPIDAPTTNRNPVDELGEVREQIKHLKEKEGLLRSEIIDGEFSLAGDDFVASVSTVKSERVDVPMLREEVGLEFLRPYMVESEITLVKVKRKTAAA